MTTDEQRDRHYASMGGQKAITVDSDAAVEADAAVAERWRVREAGLDDVPAATAAVAELLVELGGRVPDAEALEAEARALVEDPAVGILLVAVAPASVAAPDTDASELRRLYAPSNSEAGRLSSEAHRSNSEAEAEASSSRGVEGALGVLAASWGRALHVPGRYLTIQDLWVRRDWRSAGVGAGLVDALAERAAAEGVARIEVGLPRESFEAIRATERFYLGNGFEPLGPRMRRLL